MAKKTVQIKQKLQTPLGPIEIPQMPFPEPPNLKDMFERVTGRRAQAVSASVIGAVDETRNITVLALGEGLAAMTQILVYDMAAGMVYDVYPGGGTPYCTPGASNLRLAVKIRNNGAVNADLFVRIRDAAGVLFEQSQFHAVGEAKAYATGLLKMPTADYSITIEVGH